MKPRRRFFVAISAVALVQFACTKKETIDPMARAAPFVKPKERWGADHFFNFLVALPPTAMLGLKKSLGLVDQKAGEDQLLGAEQDARGVQKQLLWLSSNVFSYPLGDSTKTSYHEVATWVCERVGIAQKLVAEAPTFALERELYKSLFAPMWDKLSPRERSELLSKLDPHDQIKDKAAIAALSGAGALAALSGTVAFTGFAFYTTMSVTIATVASAVGLTLPFATYAGASSVVGILSGPVGWAFMAVAGLGGVALAGRANFRKTAALIGQVHALKIEALRAAGVSESQFFQS